MFDQLYKNINNYLEKKFYYKGYLKKDYYVLLLSTSNT